MIGENDISQEAKIESIHGWSIPNLGECFSKEGNEGNMASPVNGP